jgi:hypothetical protein
VALETPSQIDRAGAHARDGLGCQFPKYSE